jgi:hypothetical protein
MQVGPQNASTGLTGFHWAVSAQQDMAQSPLGLGGIQAMLGQFGDLNSAMSPWQAKTTVGYAALPDFKNSGALDVDKQAGTVKTPGGYEIAVKDGKVRIKSPNGKWTDLKAEPPNRTLVTTMLRLVRLRPLNVSLPAIRWCVNPTATCGAIPVRDPSSFPTVPS